MSIHRSRNVVLGCHRKKRNSIFMAILFTFTLVFTGGMVGVSTLLVGNAAAQDDGPPVAPPGLTIGGWGDRQTVLYLLNLPEGISLISSPLDAGAGRAIDAFIGIDKELPLLFEWDSSTQRFLDPEESMLSPGAGYWYYTPAPTTLLIFGKQHQLSTHLTKDINPGWHLFGVPFIEGIDWSDFHLYASGNPIGLDTAHDMGWISSDILTMQGSSWQAHEAGMPFKPGAAYWIETTVPLSVRAQAAVGQVLPGKAGAPPDLNNLNSMINYKNEMTQVGEDIKAGKLTTGGFSVSGASGAVFGLANLIVQKYRYENIMNELNTMDGKVDELLTDVAAIQNQLASMMNAIQGLQDYITVTSKFGPVQADAEQWIAEFYHDLAQAQQSYNWGRWQLAGCDVSASACVSSACVGGNTPGSACTSDADCLSCTNPVTDASSQTFATKYAKNPMTDPPALATGNFFLWWAYGVQATLAEGISYTQNGKTARNLVENIHYALTHDAGTSQNALRAYMEWVFSQSGCGTDVTACDLYAEVYQPVEVYFQQLISDQITLVEAIVESFATLASSHQETHEYDSSIDDYLRGVDGFNQKLAEEAEILVQTAEQIALYRLADGRFDWSSFGTSDAAQLLARADFAAALIVSSSIGKPWPWPPGVIGRIFYTEQTTLPSASIHAACQGTNCATLTEVAPAELHGDWPYLQWTLDPSGDVALGVPTTTWKVRRLAPQPLAAGTYQVASANPQYGSSSLVVAQYGYDYTNPPDDPTQTVLFGSFNNVEGKLGIGALGVNRTYSGGSDDKLHDFTVTPSANYTQMTVAYKQSSSFSTGDWYEKMKVNIPDNALLGTYPRIRIFWPSTIEVRLGEYSIADASCCTDHYYHKLAQSLKLLEADGDVKPGTDHLFEPCGSYDFDSCNSSVQDRNDGMMLASSSVTLKPGETYTLRAHFNDEIWGLYQCSIRTSQYSCTQGPTSGSYVTWKVFNPTFTMVK